MSSHAIPAKTTVLVIGGGPGGSYASTVLAREGISVVLLEAAKHPRDHIGESMLPSLRHYLRFIGLEETFEAHGFQHKPGACFRFAQDDVDYYTDFSTLGPGRTTWNVVRSEADELLLRYATSQSAQVFEETRVEWLDFDGSRPIRAHWTRKSGSRGSIEFDWLIDASGRQSIMATKYLKNRIVRDALRNVAVYGYWRGAAIFNEGGPRHGAPLFECLSDKLGWAWFIPLHNGTTSVGVVMHQDNSTSKKKDSGLALEAHYLDQLKLAPGILELLKDGEFVVGSVKSVGDSSYYASSYAGDHYRLVGDAAAFIDPLFSSGFHMALTGGLSAAATILASSKGQVSEVETQHWHTTKIAIAQTRFLMVVLIAYRQMQSNPRMLGALRMEQYGEAYDVFRPGTKVFKLLFTNANHIEIVYQGEKDTSNDLLNTEESIIADSQLSNLVDFSRQFFQISSDEVKEKPQHIVDMQELNHLIDSEDDDARELLRRLKMTALRNDTSEDTHDTINGLSIRFERGHLGLIRTE
ncbi:Flavin-dependent halogenase armH5 [Mycena indigotica]|uniref:Flavin-dependent halogenase armH5 n=1 Tax=Mycena indigotica TaxID=2126181 RepID=A0A8H6SDC5_9AGAR|nr:Flavin-dependent halogenase armH5 [Mycena indigotica]KAF7297349.1 Flavin-dependent halogenase armH5 [Mycena indigotica]